MSETKQEARELVARITNYLANGGLFNPEQAKHDAVSELLFECREALAAQPQEKAQPERGEWDELVEQAEKAAYQRGQQAMAEKYEIVGYGYRYPDGVRFGTGGRGINGNAPIETFPIYRSLASAEPPQGEAEKEGRT